MPAGSIAPYPLAMVVCDAIWKDPTTGKNTILGTFSQIHAREFPCQHPLLSLYIELTDCRGDVEVKVRLVDVDDEEVPLAEAASTLSIDDPRMIVSLTVVLGNVVFPSPGEFRIQLFGNDDFLLERRIIVVAIGETRE